MRCVLPFRSRLLIGAAVVFLSAPQIAAAQTADLTKVPGEKASAAETPHPAPALQGLALDPFTIDATAAAGEMFSDNIFVTKNNKESDWITTIASGLTASLVDGSNRLNLRGGVALGRYARFTTENYDDFYVGGDGRLRLDAVTSLFGGARYDWTHESRESPDAVNGIYPTKYRAGDYYLGALRSFKDFVLRVGATANTYAYDNVRSLTGIIDNTDRNRTQYEVGARVSYRWSSTLQPFVQAYWVARDYDRMFDDFGYRRSSTGYRAALGISGTLLPALEGEAYFGVLGERYDDPRFSDVTKPDFGMRLTWRPVGGTTVRGFIDRSLEETTLIGASSYLRTAIGGSLEQEIRPDLYMNGHFYYSQNAYQDAGRVDHVSDAGLGARYFLTPNFYVATDYAFIHRISDSAPADFYENRVWFRIGAQLAPAYSSDPAKFPAFRDEEAPGGFYVGLLAGNGTLISAVDGPRGGSGSAAGTLTADFGANGWQGDIAAGYGTMVGRIYLGAEFDAAAASQAWLHTGTGGTRIFGVRKLDSYELAARLGYRLESQALLYGRFGAVMTQFATPYTQNLHSVRPEGYQRGLRFGGGLDVPLGAGLSGRMEYTQTSYADYDVMPAKTADNFANSENLVRFGLVYHIDAAAPEKPAPAFDYTGFYGGLEAGFGGLISQNAGNRNFGQTLDAQRAGTGATGGVFGGYGLTIGALYVGAEAEAGISNADWNIKRDPTGRVYSVAKDYSFGGSLLAGYVFDKSTLVYGRLGVANTQFRNKYHDEGGINYVTPDDTEAGLRLGGGVATPITDDAFLRLDYSWTRYGTYRVNYVTGIDSFRNSEDLFRVGIAWKL